jgi:hypothetical protein
LLKIEKRIEKQRGSNPQRNRPEAKDACVNIALINPLSHHGSVLRADYWKHDFEGSKMEI